MIIVNPKITPFSEIDGQKILLSIQRAAKTCYKSNKNTDNVESAKKIVRTLIKSGHLSMLEFASVTMNYESNVAAYKDLRTHRAGATFSVESTRFANYSKDRFGSELKFLQPIEIEIETPEYKLWLRTMKLIEDNYMALAKMGATPDQLSLLLPHSTAAEFNISANLREWRHILSLRSSIAATGHARPCVREIMDPTLELFHEKIPVVFDDLYTKYNEKR